MLIQPPPQELVWLLLVPAAIFALAGWMVRFRRLGLPGWVARVLAGRAACVVLGVLSATIVLAVWGSLDEPGNIHDEHAYLLQAEIFASGRWTGEPPPLPEFFEQPHVFVEPRVVAKYPPGFALALAPGMWLGMPGLVPVVLSGLAGALLFAIVRRVATPMLALVIWALWSTSIVSLYWRASYYSQSLSAVLWLVSLYGLLRWTRDSRPLWLSVVAWAFAIMAITRPLTAVALAAPMAGIVLTIAWRRGLWRQLGLAVAVSLPVLLITPIWNARTMGDWRLDPYREYTRQHLPYDKPGFGLDPSPPTRTSRPPPLAEIDREFIPYHEKHQVNALAVILPSRILAAMLALGERWRTFLIACFFAGAVWSASPARFAVVSAAAVMLVYLVYAYPVWWTIYYSEVFPAFFFVAAMALATLGRAVLKLDAAGVDMVFAIGLLIAAPWLANDVATARRQNDERSAFQRQARTALQTLPQESAVVFLRYPPDHVYVRSLVRNSADYRTARLWLVYDRGADNERLLRVTDRPAYRLSTDTWALERIR